jgi:homoserine dehydrogenase
MERINIAILGLGTVGSGVVKGFEKHRSKMENTIGKEIAISRILVQNLHKKRNVSIPIDLLTTSIEDIFAQPDLSIVIEAMGGLAPTYDYVKRAIEHGCHVITANKALIANYGSELTQLAHDKGVHFLFEASVGAAIPVIHSLQHFLCVNDVKKIYGIINGTTNYILTNMLEQENSFENILSEAQDLGYAETDPTADVDGYDALYKLAILSKLCFDITPDLSLIPRQGIRDVTLEELKLAKQLGYSLKLIATAENVNQQVSLRVSPMLIPTDHPLANVNGVLNAVSVESDLAGELTFFGSGAGEFPTGSAVLGDLFYLLRNINSIPQTTVRSLPCEPKYSEQSSLTRLIFLRVPEKEATVQFTKLLQVLKKKKVTILEATQQAASEGFAAIGIKVQSLHADTVEEIQLHTNCPLSIRTLLVSQEEPVLAAV